MKKDYTKLAIGTRIDNGVIRLCPHCGRPGLLEEREGKQWYVHSEGADLTAVDAMRAAWEMCPKI